jgi:3-hydroxymyristoyl/3-hydroxydecanoyl-(acyl carrier protein) dehydratase
VTALTQTTAGRTAIDAATSGRFAAFSFVDRITAIVDGANVHGRYGIPSGIDSFPQSLAAEAVGQLAAWVSMAQFGFRVRPVAGLAEQIVYHDACGPGDALDLAVDIESCTEEAIAYSGTASVGGRAVLTLAHSVGPMLPMADFDDPDRVRADFEVLRGEGCRPGRFRGVDAPLGVPVGHERGASIEARLDVPQQAPFFADHFPRRQVFPATLLMHALSHWAVQLARDTQGESARVVSVANVKMRNWILPGQAVDLRVEGGRADGGGFAAKLSARIEGRVVATAKAMLQGDAR